jgi:lipid-A-disaccharide synthase
MSEATPTRVFIIAGEASGDMLGGALLRSLHTLSPTPLEIRGIGGEHMQAAGLRSLFPMKELSLMGFAEILPHAWRLACRLKETCDAAVAFRPHIVITIDSPSFTFRVVKWLRRCFGTDITCIHYVAPTVWAYKPERAATTAALFDHLLTLLPFEARYFNAYALPVTYVGHPIADGLRDTPPPHFRPYQVGESLHIALFPGSRKGEVTRLLPVFQETVALLHQQYRAVRVSILTTRTMRPYLVRATRQWRTPPEVFVKESNKQAVMQSAHIALTKTGTVTLEITRHGLPMVAAYRVHPLTAAAVRRWLKIPFVNLLNIISGKVVVPELLQEECTAPHLYTALRHLIDHPEAASAQCHATYAALQAMQHPAGIPASDAAAKVVLGYIGKGKLLP